MPFLSYFIFFADLQIIYIDTLCNITEMDNFKEHGKLYPTYVKIHYKITNASGKCQPFLLYIIVLLLCVGSLGLYSAFIDSIWIIKREVMSPYFSTIVVDSTFDIVRRIFEASFLMIWPLRKASAVSSAERKVVKQLLKLHLKTRNQGLQMDISSTETLQKYDGTGYLICGTPITGWKTVFIAILTPLVKSLISKLSKN